MPCYRIYRLKDHLRQQFRYAPHTSGRATLKPRDYEPLQSWSGVNDEPGETAEAPSPYAAFFALRDTEAPLQIGDVLETPERALYVFKFVGFEEAEWFVPEKPPVREPEAAPSQPEVPAL